MDHADSGPTTATLVATRRQLHGIAECLLAGPEYQATGEIALRVTPGGFGTTAGPEIRLDGMELVAGDRRVPAAGSFRNLADQLGVEFGAPAIGYRDGSGAQPNDVVDLDSAAVQVIVDWFALSDAALRVLDPGQQPILWPEHFDVAILLDNRSYGSSPGDDSHPAPYAYVSAHDHDGGALLECAVRRVAGCGGIHLDGGSGGLLARGQSVAAEGLAGAPIGAPGVQ
jgi:hypothetical protein